MKSPEDIKKILNQDDQWYKKIWNLGIMEMSWVEETAGQIRFLSEVLGLTGRERILDLACGFGRHSLALAELGCLVTGVDITPDYVREAEKQAKTKGLPVQFICSDLRDLKYQNEFDIVLNLADGAIGYLETDEENLKIFDLVSRALKPGGLHFMDIGNGGYAARHFPRRAWVLGNKTLSLADFEWDAEKSLMYYGDLEFKFGEVLTKPEILYSNPTRLYNQTELKEIYDKRGMTFLQAWGDFKSSQPATDDVFQMQVLAVKGAV
jgi:SAM-dependent methyltransferase